MGRKKKERPVTETTNKVETVKKEVKEYKYGDLAVVCKCGRIQVLQKGIEHGLQWTIVPREDSYMWLRCDECGADLKLCFLEGKKLEEPATNTQETDERIQEENKTE